MKTAWLIESANCLYIGERKHFQNTLGWTDNLNDALCFARQKDARMFMRYLGTFGIALHDDDLGATEHQWIDGVPQTPTKEEPLTLGHVIGCKCPECGHSWLEANMEKD